MWIIIIKKFLNFSLLTMVRLNCYKFFLKNKRIYTHFLNYVI